MMHLGEVLVAVLLPMTTLGASNPRPKFDIGDGDLFTIGQAVRVRDHEDDDWQDAVVTGFDCGKPKCRIKDWNQITCTYNFVELGNEFETIWGGRNTDESGFQLGDHVFVRNSVEEDWREATVVNFFKHNGKPKCATPNSKYTGWSIVKKDTRKYNRAGLPIGEESISDSNQATDSLKQKKEYVVTRNSKKKADSKPQPTFTPAKKINKLKNTFCQENKIMNTSYAFQFFLFLDIATYLALVAKLKLFIKIKRFEPGDIAELHGFPDKMMNGHIAEVIGLRQKYGKVVPNQYVVHLKQDTPAWEKMLKDSSGKEFVGKNMKRDKSTGEEYFPMAIKAKLLQKIVAQDDGMNADQQKAIAKVEDPVVDTSQTMYPSVAKIMNIDSWLTV